MSIIKLIEDDLQNKMYQNNRKGYLGLCLDKIHKSMISNFSRLKRFNKLNKKTKKGVHHE